LSLGWDSPGANGLEKLAGTWNQEELNRFERATAVFEHIDEDLWHLAMAPPSSLTTSISG
jgi:hypothetical protein